VTFASSALGVTQAGEKHLLAVSGSERHNGTSPGVIVLHGHGGDAYQAPPAPSWFGAHVKALADAGMMVLAADFGGGTTFGNSTFQTALTSAWTWLTGAGGARPGKVLLLPYSMGMLGGLHWVKSNAAKVSGVFAFAGATDLDLFHGTAGYTPAYDAGGVSPGQYAAEIDTAFGGDYATNAAGFKVRDEYASWQGIAVPQRLVHASDDATVPIGQAQAFVTGVNDPLVTLRTLSSGGHTGLFDQLSTDETVSFCATANWQ
jgi:hypothetical protein